MSIKRKDETLEQELERLSGLADYPSDPLFSEVEARFEMIVRLLRTKKWPIHKVIAELNIDIAPSLLELYLSRIGEARNAERRKADKRRVDELRMQTRSAPI